MLSQNMLLDGSLAGYSHRGFGLRLSRGEHFLHGCFPVPLLYFLSLLLQHRLYPRIGLIILKVKIDHGSP